MEIKINIRKIPPRSHHLNSSNYLPVSMGPSGKWMILISLRKVQMAESSTLVLDWFPRAGYVPWVCSQFPEKAQKMESLHSTGSPIEPSEV